jgi:FKBP-type peptidyl-prolyl cis-trans isomerases 2
MKITQGLVATLSWRMTDSQGELIDENAEGDDFYVGGDDLLPRMAEQMLGKGVGDKGDIYLQPEDAFGDYDADLLLVEERKLFPAELEEGMMFEQLPEGCSPGDADAFYTVTEIHDDKVCSTATIRWPVWRCGSNTPCSTCAKPIPTKSRRRAPCSIRLMQGLFLPGDK